MNHRVQNEAHVESASLNSMLTGMVRAESLLDWIVVAALVVVLAVGGLASPLFLTVSNLTSILIACSLLAVIAIGQTFVIIAAGIDLSVGATAQVSSVLIGIAVTHKWGVPIGIVIALVGSFAFGVLNGLIIAVGEIGDFVATLGTLSILTGLALVLSDGRPVGVISPLLTQLASGRTGPVPNIALLAGAVAIVSHIVLFHTRFGMRLFATGSNYEGSRNLGLKVARIKVSAYAICGMLAGIGGIMLTARIGSAEPAVGSAYLLGSIAASVLGGTSLFGGRGTVLGPVIGAFVLAALHNVMTLRGIGVFYQPVVTGVVVILFALVYRFQR
jgi:ribose/xylose/arabinose/galactoside ABC-type transport system permease subunit